MEMTFPMSRGLLHPSQRPCLDLVHPLVEMTFPMSRGLLRSVYDAEVGNILERRGNDLPDE